MKKLLIESLLKNKDRIAYKNRQDVITYNELYESSLFISKKLKKEGKGPVIIYGHKEIGMIKGIVACILANRAYVPIDVSLPTSRIEKIIEQSGATFIINAGEKICPVKVNAKENYEINNTAYIIFTSGSTGQPKGIPISYDNLKNFCKWIKTVDGFNAASKEVIFNQANFNFDLSVVELFFGLLNGHTVLGVDKEELIDSDLILSKIKNEDVSFMVLTPTYLRLLLSNQDFNQEKITELKCVYCCGETLQHRIAVKMLERFPNITLINAYGPTEATSAVSAVRITKQICDKYESVPVGNRFNFATSLTFEDSEIVLSGASVFDGYLGDFTGGFYEKEGTNFYKTGDCGYILDDYLFFKNRVDFQIKYKGYRIELEEIENVIKSIKGIFECVCLPKKDREGNVLFIKAYVCGEINDSSFIKNEIKKKLPDYMIPKTIKFVEKMPVNSNGKIDRKELEEND